MGVENLESVSPDDSTELNLDAAMDTKSDAGSDADSSPASEGDKFDLLSVVRNATSDKEEDDVASPASPEEPDSTDTAKESSTELTPEETKTAEPDEENFSDVPFHNHPRFKALIAQRNEYRDGAEQYQNVQNFLQEQGLSPEDAADMLLIRAQMKTDPASAWKTLKPMVQQLLMDAGEVLPEDLRKQVAAGAVSREAAMEISRLRAGQASTAKAQEHQQTVSEKQAAQQAQQDIQGSVASWERATRAKDPDFDKKSEALMKELTWIHRKEGVAKSPEDARKQVEAAYDAVNQTVKASRAPKPAVDTLTGGRAKSENVSAAPSSMLEIVKSAGATGT